MASGSTVCAASGSPTVTADNQSRKYLSFVFTNDTGSDACVTLTYASTNAKNLSIAAYLGSFNPNSIGTNFLASPTLGASCGGTSGSFSFKVPFGQSFVIVVSECTPGGGGAFTFSMESHAVLAAEVVAFGAKAMRTGTRLRWRTGTELHALGFNVYRERRGHRVRLNRRLIAAVGSLTGASYSFVDRHAPRSRSGRYWLQDVDTHGARTWHGPISVRSA